MAQNLYLNSVSEVIWVMSDCCQDVNLWWWWSLCAKVKIINPKYKCLFWKYCKTLLSSKGWQVCVWSLKTIRNSVWIYSHPRLPRVSFSPPWDHQVSMMWYFPSSHCWGIISVSAQAFLGPKWEDCFAIWMPYSLPLRGWLRILASVFVTVDPSHFPTF